MLDFVAALPPWIHAITAIVSALYVFVSAAANVLPRSRFRSWLTMAVVDVGKAKALAEKAEALTLPPAVKP